MALTALVLAVFALAAGLSAWAALVWLAARANRLAAIVTEHPSTLRASRADTITAASPAPITSADVDASRREISGLIVPYDVPGDTSGGTYTVAAGAFSLPADLARIKLLYGHDRDRPIGYLTAVRDEPDGLYGTFTIGTGPDAEAGLQAARERLRDGLSYEVSHVTVTGDRVTAARLDAVALCSIPAYDDARAIAATRQGAPMFTLETARAALADADADAPTRAAAAAFLAAHPEATDADRTAAADETGDGADPTGAGATPPAESGSDSTGSAGGSQTGTQAPGAPVAAARRPFGITAGAGPAIITASQAAQHIAGVARGALDAGQINAALADIVPAFDSGQGFVGRGQWIDELWSSSYVQRDFIDSYGRGELTGFKVYGWRWVNKPQVGPWEGNKSEIPSSEVKTEPAEAAAKYLAGGNDVAREIVDLGDPGILSALFAAYTQDYAVKSEAAFAAEVNEAATVAPDPATDLLEALDIVARALSMRGANLSSIAISADLWSDYLGISASDAPWWLARQASVNLRDVTTEVAGIRVFCSHTLPAGTVIGGDRRAITYYEHSPAPIRVQALNIPQGGIDVAVFGYHATLVHDASALVKVNVGGAAPAAAAKTTTASK